MEINSQLLTRYFTGEASEEEKEAIRRWLESDEAHRKRFVRERMRFDASVIADEDRFLANPAGSKGRVVMMNILKAASVVLLLIGCSFFYSRYKINELSQSMQHVYVPPGSRTSLTLAEGSTVWLNSNTTFGYPGFFRDERIVEMNGEGFFDIAKDAGKPFIIHTDKYSVEVLGTSFNMESYASGSVFEMALFTGNVKLYASSRANTDTLFLNAGETATLVGDRLVVSKTDFDKYRWREGIIVIEDKSFEEIMSLYEKYFDVQVVLKTDEVKNLGYSGKFRIADGIDHALRVLRKDFRFSYKREEDSNIIYIY